MNDNDARVYVFRVLEYLQRIDHTKNAILDVLNISELSESVYIEECAPATAVRDA